MTWIDDIYEVFMGAGELLTERLLIIGRIAVFIVLLPFIMIAQYVYIHYIEEREG